MRFLHADFIVLISLLTLLLVHKNDGETGSEEFGDEEEDPLNEGNLPPINEIPDHQEKKNKYLAFGKECDPNRKSSKDRVCSPIRYLLCDSGTRTCQCDPKMNLVWDPTSRYSPYEQKDIKGVYEDGEKEKGQCRVPKEQLCFKRLIPCVTGLTCNVTKGYRFKTKHGYIWPGKCIRKRLPRKEIKAQSLKDGRMAPEIENKASLKETSESASSNTIQTPSLNATEKQLSISTQRQSLNTTVELSSNVTKPQSKPTSKPTKKPCLKPGDNSTNNSTAHSSVTTTVQPSIDTTGRQPSTSTKPPFLKTSEKPSLDITDETYLNTTQKQSFNTTRKITLKPIKQPCLKPGQNLNTTSKPFFNISNSIVNSSLGMISHLYKHKK